MPMERSARSWSPVVQLLRAIGKALICRYVPFRATRQIQRHAGMRLAILGADVPTAWSSFLAERMRVSSFMVIELMQPKSRVRWS